MRPRDLSDEAEQVGFGDEHGREYAASGGSKRCPMVLVVPTPAYAMEDQLIPYPHIQHVLVRKDGRSIVIELGYLTILIIGRNLRAVGLALGAHACSRLEAFDKDRRDMPPPEKPFIETIEYLTRKMADDTGKAPPPPKKHEPETLAKQSEKAT